MIYRPDRWFWVVAGADGIYCSARATFVPSDDATYLAWVGAGGAASPIASAAELVDVLTAAGIAIGDDIRPSPTETEYGAAIQSHLDAAARSRGYDSALSIATYVGSSIPLWAAEAAVFFAWRDAVWAYAYAELSKVRAGQRPQPGVPALIAELPAIAWPA